MIHSQYLSALDVKRPTVDSDAIVPSYFLTNMFRLKCPTACVYSSERSTKRERPLSENPCGRGVRPLLAGWRRSDVIWRSMGFSSQTPKTPRTCRTDHPNTAQIP